MTETGTEAVGVVWAQYLPPEEPGYGFLAEDAPEVSLWVREDRRGRGLGTALLRRMQDDEARARGVPRISLSVETGNYAKRLYLAEGFVDVPGRESDGVMVWTPQQAPCRACVVGIPGLKVPLMPQGFLHRIVDEHRTCIAGQLLSCSAELRVLNLSGGRGHLHPDGLHGLHVMAASAQRGLEITRGRSTDQVVTRWAAGKDLGGRRQTFTDSQIRNALRLIEGGEPATQVARDLGMSRASLYRRMRELPTPGM